jgi:hypothetical protein
MSIYTDLSGLKQMGKDFFDALPTATLEEIEAGFDCFAIGYLNANLPTRSDKLQAECLLRIVSREALFAKAKAPTGGES